MEQIAGVKSVSLIGKLNQCRSTLFHFSTWSFRTRGRRGEGERGRWGEGEEGREGERERGREGERRREGEMEGKEESSSIYIIYMLCAKYGFAQSTDCPVQTINPYFVRAIHGLHSLSINVYSYI